MMKKFRKTAASVTVMAMVLSAGMLTAFAAEDTSYGYLTGQQQGSLRHSQFTQAADLSSDAEREAYLAAHGIGGDGTYSTSEHLDVQELVSAGVIDQATADRITAAASDKHAKLQAGYAGKSSMSPEQRQAFYEGLKADGFSGDSVEELLSAGIITQEQANAINSYLSK